MSKVIALFDFFYGRHFSSTFIHKRTMLHSRLMQGIQWICFHAYAMYIAKRLLRLFFNLLLLHNNAW